MNTKIEYLYRDACNYKVWNCAILPGEITDHQIDQILACLEDGEFIPEQVNLPAVRFDSYTEDDLPWMELNRTGFSLTSEKTTESCSIETLVERFRTVKWNENFTLNGNRIMETANMQSLRERDIELERLWNEFANVPINPETEKLEEAYLYFPAGTDREDVWHWFDNRHSKGIGHLMYNDGIDRTNEIAQLMFLKQFCFECESASCQFNHRGECRFALVHERKPRINDYDGCIDYDFSEGDCP